MASNTTKNSPPEFTLVQSQRKLKQLQELTENLKEIFRWQSRLLSEITCIISQLEDNTPGPK